MSRRSGTLIAVLAVLVIGIAAVVWVTRPKPAPVGTAPARAELSKGDAAKLARVVLADRTEGSLTLVKTAGKWNTEPPRRAALAEFSIDDLLSTFAALSAERTLEERPTDLAQFGLAPPRVTATGTWEDGTARTLLLGDKTPTGTTYYLQVKGDPKVYTVASEVGQRLHWTLNDIRSKAIEPSINYDEVTYVKLVTHDGAVIEAKRKTEEETRSFQLGFGAFIMTRPYATLRGLDAQKQDSLIKATQSVVIADFADDSPASLEKYGLARPRAEMIVRDKTNALDFLFGSEKGTQTYFMVRGQPGVYLVDTSSLDFLRLKPFDLIDKFTFIPNIEDVDRLDITAGGKTHALIIARTTKKAAKAGDPDEVTASYTVDGKSVEEDNFKAFYQAVIALQVEGEVARKVPNTPELTVKYTLNKGAVRVVRVDYAPYDRDFDAIFLNGIGEFALTKGQLSAMRDKLDLLVAGKKVPN